MSTENWTNPPSSGFDESGTQASTTDAVKSEAGAVGEEAKGAGQHVAGVAQAEAKEVAHEVGQQTRNLAGQVGEDLKSQAATQQQRVSEGLRSISDELHGMAARSEEDGTATHLVRQAATKVADVSRWMEDRDPGSLLDDVKGFARRRPGAFLAIAAGAGLLAGRLTRGLTAGSTQSETGRTPGTARTYPPTDFPADGLTTGAPMPVTEPVVAAPPPPVVPPAVEAEPIVPVRGPDPLATDPRLPDRPLAGGGLAPGVPNAPDLGDPGRGEPDPDRW